MVLDEILNNSSIDAIMFLNVVDLSDEFCSSINIRSIQSSLSRKCNLIDQLQAYLVLKSRTHIETWKKREEESV